MKNERLAFGLFSEGGLSILPNGIMAKNFTFCLDVASYNATNPEKVSQSYELGNFQAAASQISLRGRQTRRG